MCSLFQVVLYTVNKLKFSWRELQIVWLRNVRTHMWEATLGNIVLRKKKNKRIVKSSGYATRQTKQTTNSVHRPVVSQLSSSALNSFQVLSGRLLTEWDFDCVSHSFHVCSYLLLLKYKSQRPSLCQCVSHEIMCGSRGSACTQPVRLLLRVSQRTALLLKNVLFLISLEIDHIWGKCLNCAPLKGSSGGKREQGNQWFYQRWEWKQKITFNKLLAALLPQVCWDGFHHFRNKSFSFVLIMFGLWCHMRCDKHSSSHPNACERRKHGGFQTGKIRTLYV